MIHQQAEIRMVHHLEAGGTFCLAFEECLATSGRGFVKAACRGSGNNYGDDPKDGQNPRIILVQEEIF
jgi:hypothetical protein